MTHTIVIFLLFVRMLFKMTHFRVHATVVLDQPFKVDQTEVVRSTPQFESGVHTNPREGSKCSRLRNIWTKQG